jgi:dTDP-4-dehydrorhamnose reductase
VNVLVTGAAGRLGSTLCERLRVAGSRPVGLDLPDLDITDPASVHRALRDAAPEAVVQCAAFADVDGAERREEAARAVNEAGARNVALACAAAGSWLIQISTDFVFRGDGSRPCREDDPTDPRGVYAVTKRAGETAVLEALPSALVVRTAWLYGGPGNDFVRAVLARAREGKPLRVVRDQVGSPTLVDDLAGALVWILALGERPAGYLHVANAGSCSRLEQARAAVEAAGLAVAVEGIDTSDLPAGGAPRPSYSVLDCSLYDRLTGCSMRPWREALEGWVRALPQTPENGSPGGAPDGP